MRYHTALATDRLILKPLAETDTAFIRELVNTEGWITFIGDRNIYSDEAAAAYITKINSNEHITYWTVQLRETPVTIGLITLIKRDYLPHNDIGFAFLPGFAGKGYAYEAAKTVLDEILKQEGITAMLAVTLPENTASIKLIKKLGLGFDKTFEHEGEKLHLYSALREQLLVL